MSLVPSILPPADVKTDGVAWLQDLGNGEFRNRLSHVTHHGNEVTGVSWYTPSAQSSPDLVQRVADLETALPDLEETPDITALDIRVKEIEAALGNVTNPPNLTVLTARVATLELALAGLDQAGDITALQQEIDTIKNGLADLEETADIDAVAARVKLIEEALAAELSHEEFITARVVDELPASTAGTAIVRIEGNDVFPDAWYRRNPGDGAYFPRALPAVALPVLTTDGQTLTLDGVDYIGHVDTARGAKGWADVNAAVDPAVDWIYSTDGMVAADGQHIIARRGHVINLPDAPAAGDTIEFAPENSSWPTLTGTFSPAVDWTVADVSNVAAGSEIVTLIADVDARNWVAALGAGQAIEPRTMAHVGGNLVGLTPGWNTLPELDYRNFGMITVGIHSSSDDRLLVRFVNGLDTGDAFVMGAVARSGQTVSSPAVHQANINWRGNVLAMRYESGGTGQALQFFASGPDFAGTYDIHYEHKYFRE